MNEVLEQFKSAQERFKVAKSVAEELEKSLAPAGTFAIPELLDKRRLEYGIPNGAFASYPTFDKVFVYQIPLPGQGAEHFSEGGAILKPEAVQSWERNTSPRGIIVSCGLQAMDCLYSTGVEIGHIVRFKKLSPFVMPVGEVKGKQFFVYVLRDGDIESSDDLAEALNARRLQIANRGEGEREYDFRIKSETGTSGKKRSAYYDASV